MSKVNRKELSTGKALFPIAVLFITIIYGLLIGPLLLDQKASPIEFIFLIAGGAAVSQLLWMGYQWDEIMENIASKISKALPAILVLLTIGMVIGSWIASGTIPMLVYYGIELIHPDAIYVVAFVVPVIFSMLTGTSWGSAGTIGVVLMGVAISYDAHLPIVAAAVIGGSFFGDKMSPLSDTTNAAAIAVEVSVYDHIKAMFKTTLPAAGFALVFYLIAGAFFPVNGDVSAESPVIKETLADTSRLFNFNLLLLLPPVIVLYGSIRRIPTLSILIISSLVALILAFIFQDWPLSSLLDSLFNGFDLSVASFEPAENVKNLFNRGGMYSLSQPIFITLLVFIFVGATDKIKAMPHLIDKLLSFVKTKGGLIRAALISTGFVNAMTSNQFATSFIVGDAYKEKYDKAGIKRSVLSRSLEDTGTMIEPLIPWHATAVYMATTLGVAVADYWYWHVFALGNVALAFVLTIFKSRK
ncbi:MAG: Na+/H+ antiporter NhaC family protein [Crocinitomicaceae bacterium]